MSQTLRPADGPGPTPTKRAYRQAHHYDRAMTAIHLQIMIMMIIIIMTAAAALELDSGRSLQSFRLRVLAIRFGSPNTRGGGLHLCHAPH